MTDMRATERLLEVIEEKLSWISGEQDSGPADDEQTEMDRAFAEMSQAITELRRRGDTLIRRDDLRVVLACLHEDLKPGGWLEETDPDHDGGRRRVLGVRDRLEAAIGGKL